MTHYTDEDLILYYYGEAGRRGAAIELHLEECEACRAEYGGIAGTLERVAGPDVPARGENYGAVVWERIHRRLPEPDAPWWSIWLGWNRLGWVAAAAVVVLAALVVGRSVLRHEPSPAGTPTVAADVAPDPTSRVRQAAIGEHLERSERVLLDLMNSGGGSIDVRRQQARAEDLLDENRLYRDAAEHAGEGMVAGVLDELERSLLEIARGPSTLTPAELDALRLRLDAAALLFKVRVLHDELRERQTAPATPRKTT